MKTSAKKIYEGRGKNELCEVEWDIFEQGQFDEWLDRYVDGTDREDQLKVLMDEVTKYFHTQCPFGQFKIAASGRAVYINDEEVFDRDGTWLSEGETVHYISVKKGIQSESVTLSIPLKAALQELVDDYRLTRKGAAEKEPGYYADLRKMFNEKYGRLPDEAELAIAAEKYQKLMMDGI